MIQVRLDMRIVLSGKVPNTSHLGVTAIINQALDRSPASESVRNVLGNLQADEVSSKHSDFNRSVPLRSP